MTTMVHWVRSEWDRLAGFLLAGAGAILIVGGAFAANGAANTLDALSYIATAGLIGVLLLGVGLALVVTASLHDEWRKLDRIESALRGEPLPDAEEVLALVRETSVSGRQPAAGGVVSVPGALPGRDSVTAAVALNPPWGRLLPGVLLLPLTAVAFGIREATQSPEYSESLGGVWLAVGGIIAGLGVIGFHAAGLGRRVVRRRDEVLARQRAGHDRTFSPGADASGHSVWVVEGLDHFHRRDCAAIIGTDAVRIARGAVNSELVPCGLCDAGG
jgi:hypothetical protein